MLLQSIGRYVLMGALLGFSPVAWGCESTVQVLQSVAPAVREKSIAEMAQRAKQDSMICGIGTLYITNRVQATSEKPGAHWAERMVKYYKERGVTAVAQVSEGNALEPEGYFAIYVRGHLFEHGTFAELSAAHLDASIAGLQKHASNADKFVTDALTKRIDEQIEFYRLSARRARANWYATFDDPEVKEWASTEAERLRVILLRYATYAKLLE